MQLQQQLLHLSLLNLQVTTPFAVLWCTSMCASQAHLCGIVLKVQLWLAWLQQLLAMWQQETIAIARVSQ